jgi:hypothetical protein
VVVFAHLAEFKHSLRLHPVYDFLNPTMAEVEIGACGQELRTDPWALPAAARIQYDNLDQLTRELRTDSLE